MLMLQNMQPGARSHWEGTWYVQWSCNSVKW